MAVNDVVEVTMNAILNHDRVSFSCYYSCLDAGTDPSPLADLAGGFDTLVAQIILAEMSVDVIYNGLYLRRLLPTLGAIAQFQPEATTPGRALQALPSTAALVVKLTTASTLPRHQGRIFVFGLCEADLENSGFSAASLAGPCLNISNALKADVFTTGTAHWVPGRLDRIEGGVKLVPPVFNVVTGGHPRRRVSTQRKRRSPWHAHIG